jgi:hypothetical protein
LGEDSTTARGQADSLEADAAAAFPEFLGIETGQAKVEEAFDKMTNHSRLAATWQTCEKQVLDVRNRHVEYSFSAIIRPRVKRLKAVLERASARGKGQGKGGREKGTHVN